MCLQLTVFGCHHVESINIITSYGHMSTTNGTVTFYGALFREGDVWICMECMDTSLDKFYTKAFKRAFTFRQSTLCAAYLCKKTWKFLHLTYFHTILLGFPSLSLRGACRTGPESDPWLQKSIFFSDSSSKCFTRYSMESKSAPSWL